MILFFRLFSHFGIQLKQYLSKKRRQITMLATVTFRYFCVGYLWLKLTVLFELKRMCVELDNFSIMCPFRSWNCFKCFFFLEVRPQLSENMIWYVDCILLSLFSQFGVAIRAILLFVLVRLHLVNFNPTCLKHITVLRLLLLLDNVWLISKIKKRRECHLTDLKSINVHSAYASF